MTQRLGDLFQEIKDRIAKVRGLTNDEDVEPDDRIKIHNRAFLLFSLDCLLDEYRTKNASLYSALRGRDALHHLLLKKYGWTLYEIRSLTLADSLFAIQDELVFDKLPQAVQGYLKENHWDKFSSTFDDLTDQEWDPMLGNGHFDLTQR
ncbi:hypothetical protein [Erwinia sp. B116]|uniref:ECs1072 family phage-associated protein n=1 Tax=Erwinia sp. B116 TaxID=1561024 RepID=UPI000CA69C38|nr:hypothetical protein [Erwinia sp. B116]PLV57075.1 hypothetical protein NV64_16210 [Erwinia sp. B116]